MRLSRALLRPTRTALARHGRPPWYVVSSTIRGAFVTRSTRVVLDYAAEFEVNPIVQGAAAGTWSMAMPATSSARSFECRAGSVLPARHAFCARGRRGRQTSRATQPRHRPFVGQALDGRTGKGRQCVDAWARVRTLTKSSFSLT